MNKLLIALFIALAVGLGGMAIFLIARQSGTAEPGNGIQDGADGASGAVNGRTARFSHAELPGFEFEYPEMWEVEVKKFNSNDSRGFRSAYFPNCHENCMGVRLTGGGSSVEMIFDRAADNNSVRCSDKAVFTSVGSGWYRVEDSQGKHYVLRPALDSVNMFPGEKADSGEWSSEAGKKYRICEYGYGEFLKEGASGRNSILMEWPRSTAPADELIRSIKGLK